MSSDLVSEPQVGLRMRILAYLGCHSGLVGFLTLGDGSPMLIFGRPGFRHELGVSLTLDSATHQPGARNRKPSDSLDIRLDIL